MSTQATSFLEPLEAWVLSTYQRRERLRVPTFDHLSTQHRLDLLVGAGTSERAFSARVLSRQVAEAELLMLPTDLPRDVDTSATLSEVQRLSLLFRYLAAPLRYQPDTESAVHKAVPSSRGMFPLGYALLRRCNGVVVAYEYVPAHHALRPLAPQDPTSLSPEVSVALVCVAQIWRVAEVYGEFSHFPCTLEAGHAYAQLHHLVAALQMQADVEVGREAGRSLCRHDFELPLFAVALKLEAIEDALPRRRVLFGEWQAPPDLASRFPRFMQMQCLFDTGHGDGHRPRGAGPVVQRMPMLAAMRSRSAGNDRGGIAARFTRYPAALGAELISTWVALRNARVGLACEDRLSLLLAWLIAGDMPVGACGVEGMVTATNISSLEFKRSLAAMLPFPNFRLNLSTLLAVAIIEVDPPTALMRDGTSALRDMHLAAGAVAQDLCLAAAMLGLFARPVRMMREVPLEIALKMRGQAIYLVLLGTARRSRLSMELL